jgi:hypothetical protein
MNVNEDSKKKNEKFQEDTFNNLVKGKRFAILDFSYTNNTSFEIQLFNSGNYSINLGDYIQSYAVKCALLSLGIAESQICYIDRDNLRESAEEFFLIMNGVFYPHCFPLPDNITPIFFGFSYHKDNIFPWDNEASFFKALINEKKLHNTRIGCRDRGTMDILQQLGHDVFFSGCLSQSFDRVLDIEKNKKNRKPLICGIDDDMLVSFLKNELPDHIFMVNQRHFFEEFPLNIQQREKCRTLAEKLIDFYSESCSQCFTSLLHCAGPCASLGIPSVVLRKDPLNVRFSAISDYISIMPSNVLYTINDINDVSKTINIRYKMIQMFKMKIYEDLICEDVLQ